MHSNSLNSTIHPEYHCKSPFLAQKSLPQSIHDHIQRHGPHEIKHIFLNHLAPPQNAYPRDCRLHGGPPPYVCRLHSYARGTKRRPAACLRRFVLLRPQLERYLDSAALLRGQLDSVERLGGHHSSEQRTKPLDNHIPSIHRPSNVRKILHGPYLSRSNRQRESISCKPNEEPIEQEV